MEHTRSALKQVVSRGLISSKQVLVRFDPALNRAIDIALGEELIRRAGGNRIELTPKGKELAQALNSAENAYQIERTFMQEIRQGFTEAIANEIFGGPN